ncbi:MAG: hypothetical protein U0350_24685 [Caldilineaceae bacterium]
MVNEFVTLDIPFAILVKAAQKLSLEQKVLLVKSLQIPGLNLGPTRDELIVELHSLHAAGAFAETTSLRNQFASSGLKPISDEQLLTDIRHTANEWEKELSEFFDIQH